MKTLTYNPSPLEIDFANALESLKDQIEQKVKMRIIQVENDTTIDNPLVRYHLIDDDGDKHQVVVRIIQKPDDYA